jgi:hypothetical protein
LRLLGQRHTLSRLRFQAGHDPVIEDKRSMNSQAALRPRTLGTAVLLLTAAACAAPNNPDTDWFQQAGSGVFVHYLAGLQNGRESIHSLGRETPWDECVHEFDCERFAQTMEEVGAGYVVFTVMQVARFMIAPNATFDRISGYQPGEACASRDLIEDLCRSLNQRGIPLLLYYTGDGPRADAKANAGFGFDPPVSAEFVERWTAVAREYSLRYGDKIKGWWVDGCYPWIGYNHDNLALFANALKAGNPRAIVAFNRGVDPLVMSYTPAEDFTCGEQNRFLDMPSSRWLDGEQWHILSYLGSGWGHPGSQYSKRDLREYVFDVVQRGGVVSIDVLLFRDGSLDRSQVEILKNVRQELREGKTRAPIPPGNLAYRKQGQLLSLDGSHELQVNCGTAFPRLGVDGDPKTCALAGGEWPWTYHVDLVDSKPVQRIKVTFGSGYPTQLEITLSADGKAWQTVAAKADHDGSPFETTMAPVVARYVRVCSIKPDGPGQKGVQMMVAELEVYE